MTEQEFQMLQIGEHVWTKSGKYEPVQWFAFFDGEKWRRATHEEANGAYVGFGDYKEYIHREDMTLEPTKKLRQAELSLMTIPELKDWCQKWGLSTKGNKEDLIRRIRQAIGKPTIVTVTPSPEWHYLWPKNK